MTRRGPQPRQPRSGQRGLSQRRPRHARQRHAQAVATVRGQSLTTDAPFFFFLNDPAPPKISPLPLPAPFPILPPPPPPPQGPPGPAPRAVRNARPHRHGRS